MYSAKEVDDMRYTLWVRIGKRWYPFYTNLAAWQLELIDVESFDGYWVETQVADRSA